MSLTGGTELTGTDGRVNILRPTAVLARGDSRHAAKVERVARMLRTRVSNAPISFTKRSAPHHVPKGARDKRYTDDKLDLSDLDELLEIDADARTCTAEPGLTFDALVRATLPHGLLPTVVPELRTITVGGAIAGCSLESMSFEHGGFHDSCLEYEVVTARGDVLRATPDNDESLLFQMMHGSFGTLGVLTRVKFKLVPARSFVHVRYERYSTLADYLAAIRRHCAERDVDFMDGMIHSPTELILSVGDFVDEAPYHNSYDWMKVYYRSTRERTEDYLRTPDYLFRYDHGVTNVHPKSALGRLLFGPFMHSDRLLRLAGTFRRFLTTDRPRVTVDLFIPAAGVEQFMALYRERVGFYPIWCVPYRVPKPYAWLSKEMVANIHEDLFLDLAIYGMEQPPGRNVYKELEDELQAVHGVKTLISYNYYDRETFWRIFNRENWEAVKRRTDPTNIFRDLYSKTCRAPLGLPDL